MTKYSFNIINVFIHIEFLMISKDKYIYTYVKIFCHVMSLLHNINSMLNTNSVHTKYLQYYIIFFTLKKHNTYNLSYF